MFFPIGLNAPIITRISAQEDLPPPANDPPPDSNPAPTANVPPPPTPTPFFDAHSDYVPRLLELPDDVASDVEHGAIPFPDPTPPPQSQPSQPSSRRPLMPSHGGWGTTRDVPRFMTLPFPPDPQMVLLQGWYYDSGGLQSGIDYFKWDKEHRFQGFPVVASADGYACGQLDDAVAIAQGSGLGCVRGFGHRVFVRHNVRGETFYTYYGHLETIADDIPLGSRSDTVFVERGQVLGYAGNTGTNGGAIHLHFGLLSPVIGWIDPYDIRAKHQHYPDPMNTNGILSGPNYFWTTNPPSYAGELSEGYYLDSANRFYTNAGQQANGREGSRGGTTMGARFDTAPALNDEESDDEEGDVWAPEGGILFPTNNAVVAGRVRVHGWADVRGSTINKVEIWIDGALRHTETYSDSHHRSLGAYHFSWMWDTSQEANSNHTITVKGFAENGTTTLFACEGGEEQTVEVNTVVQNPQGYVDPLPEKPIIGTYAVRGWVKVEGSEVERIETWVDGEHRGYAEYGLYREDVGGEYGFVWEWDTSGETWGVHTLSVKAVSTNGGKTTIPLSPAAAQTTGQPTLILVTVDKPHELPLGKWTLK